MARSDSCFEHSFFKIVFSRGVRMGACAGLLFLTGCVDTLSLPLPDFNSLVQAGNAKHSSSREGGERFSEEDSSKQNSLSHVQNVPQTVSFKRIRSENLLAVNGHWNMIEQGSSYDPAKAHLAARKKVNTHDFKKKKELSAHFKPDALSGKDGTLRILRVAQGGGQLSPASYSKYEVAGRSVTTPKRAIGEKSGGSKGTIWQALFGGGGRSDDSYVSLAQNAVKAQPQGALVAPARKPVKEVGYVQVNLPVRDIAMISPASGGYKGLGHSVLGGVVLKPPRLPARRMYAKKTVVERVASLPVVQVSPAVGRAYLGVPIPARKPGGRVQRGVVSAQAYALKNSRQYDAKNSVPVRPVSKPHSEVSVRGKITQIRSGKHSGMVRLVLEVSEMTKYSARIDALRGVLRIEIKNSVWDALPQNTFANNVLLGTYVARQKGGGACVVGGSFEEENEDFKFDDFEWTQWGGAPYCA